MDINALAKTIAAIIKADGSATVPGLGKFSVAKSSAKLSDDGTIIYPPKIELDFVQDYEEAGIDTIERYASQTGKERECAANEIKECVGEIKRQLIENGTVVMPQMGEITLDKENRPSFKMAERCILAAELFGLEPVALRPKAGFSKDKVILQQEKPEAREENKPQEQQNCHPALCFPPTALTASGKAPLHKRGTRAHGAVESITQQSKALLCYPIVAPLPTISSGVINLILPPCSEAIRIIPLDSIPLILRGARFANMQIWRPTICSGV